MDDGEIAEAQAGKSLHRHHSSVLASNRELNRLAISPE
jgi:hypothetical protein